MDDGVAFMFLNGFDERRQIANVALDHGDVGGAEFVRQKIFARREVIKYHAIAALDRVLRVGSADQS